MEELLSNPAVQGGVAPFLAGLVATLVFMRLRLAGLAVVAGFLTCTYFVSGFHVSPLTVTRKIVLLAIAAPVIGVLIDFAFKPNPMAAGLLGLAAAAGALWTFWPVIAAKPAAEAWRLGAIAALSVGFMVAFGQRVLAPDAVRAGAAGLALGLGVGVAAIFGASAALGLQGIAVAAASGAFLLPQMVRGRKIFAGATFTFPAMLTAGLIAAAAMVLAQLPWFAVAALAVVPVGAGLPVPGRAPVWLQAVLCSLYAFIIAGAACVLAWPEPI